VAFVEVNASLHHHHRRSVYARQDHPPLMSDHGRRFRAGDVGVGDGGLDLEGIDDVAESRAEDHADLRLNGGFTAYETHGVVDCFDHGFLVWTNLEGGV